MYVCIHLPKVCHVKKIYMFIIARGIKPIYVLVLLWISLHPHLMFL